MSVDYKDTVFLPQTAFPMKGELPKREPELLARWDKLGLYRRLREQSKGREKFVLHDGPPYANGHLHIGTGLNKILKDVVNRTQQMLGKDANYVPGWDCHGLPIEWKIEEEYRARKQDKDQVPIVEFRRQCRDFAARWIEVQRKEFRRLGVEGDWDNYYSTMSYKGEAQIVRELAKFAMNGSLYKGSKPVMWSVVEKTALAEAEIEYHDHKSTTIYVRFPIMRTAHPQLGGALAGAGIVIWTTTPWTIPGNRALAYGDEIRYELIEVVAVEDGSGARIGDRLVLGKPLGVGVLSAALKKEVLDARGYARMIEHTTRLNTPGPELAALDGVHAMTDVTGFGLAGHALEMARGSGNTVSLDLTRVPLIEGARDLAAQGLITGASGRNWAAYGHDVQLSARLSDVDRHLLTDPQTSGGLLVSCAPESVNDVLAVFHRHGFADAAEIGGIEPDAGPGIRLCVN